MSLRAVATTRTAIPAAGVDELEVLEHHTELASLLSRILVLPLIQAQAALDKLNAQDFRRWLGSHGASPSSLDAAPLSALYDLAFAYRNGNSSDPYQASMAAGVTLRFALEFVLDYRDAPLWRMRAGMGDVIFTPFYQVLRDRGVNIRLFHAVRELEPSADGRSVERIRIDRQADFVDGSYDPLVRVGELDCWPNQPCWDQLCDGRELEAAGVNFESVWDTTSVETIELEAGRDFDVVILAVPPEMQKHVAPKLAPAGSRFETMLRNSVSVCTVSTQLWMSKKTGEISDYAPEPLMGTLPDPYDTWADMSDVLPAECWPGGTVQSVQYICGVTESPSPGKDPIGEGHRLAEQHATDWLAANAARVWPLTSWPAAPGTGPSPIVSSYYRGNLEPSELYVLTPGGNNVASRLAGADTGYTNLVVAGDWTRTRFSGGCFESAIEAGMLASRAISGKPEDIVGEE